MIGRVFRAVGTGIVLGTVLALCAIELAEGDGTLRGRAQVVDGDDLYVDARKVRLHGIDALEWDQTCETRQGRVWPCGAAAKAFLQSLVQGREVACEKRSWSKKYKRWNATCYMNGQDIANYLVAAGYAFDMPQFSGGHYMALEFEADEKGRGAWSGEFLMPHLWREQQAAKTLNKLAK